MSARILDSVEIGTALTTSVHEIDLETLVRYAGASGDFARIHYDLEYARLRGFAGLVVHGLLKASYLAELARSWGGAGAQVTAFSVRYVGVDLAPARITCRGEVTSVDPEHGTVGLRLWTESSDERVTTEATATIRWPR